MGTIFHFLWGIGFSHNYALALAHAYFTFFNYFPSESNGYYLGIELLLLSIPIFVFLIFIRKATCVSICRLYSTVSKKTTGMVSLPLQFGL